MITQKFLHSVSLSTLWNVQTLLEIIAKCGFPIKYELCCIKDC